MENIYSFEYKKEAINQLTKNKLKKSININTICTTKIKEESDFCLYCMSNEVSIDNKFCSNICKNIFFSLIIYNKNISFFPFNFLTKISKIKLRDFISNLKSLDYDKIIIINNFENNNEKFKTNVSKFLFIKNFSIIFSKELTLQIVIFKSLNIKNDIEINKEIDNNCIFCNNTKNENFLIHIINKYYIGKMCSIFCKNVIFTNYSNIIKQPYKYSYSLPLLYALNDIEEIVKEKKKNDSKIYFFIINSDNTIIIKQVFNT